MTKRRRVLAEYKREAVARLQSPGVNVRQLAAELGIGANVLGRWRRELREEQHKAFQGHRRSLAKDPSLLGQAAAFFAKAST